MIYVWLLAAAAVLVVLNVYRYGAHVFQDSAVFILYLYAAVFSVIMLALLSPAHLRARAKRLACKFAGKEETAYSKGAVLSFYDDHIYERSEIKEEAVLYNKISRYHIGETAIYIFTTAVNAYILPRRVLSRENEDAFIVFLKEKLSAVPLD